MAFLELRGVGKGYGKGAARMEVLANIDLQVERGEFVAIVGYSGAGKTTLVSLMAGLTSPISGSDPARRQAGHRARARTAASCSRTTRCCPG